MLITSGLLIALAVREKGGARPSARSALATLVVVASVVVVPATLQESLAVWGLAALLIAATLFTGLRLLSADPALAPGVVGTVTALNSLAFALDAPHPGARTGGTLAALVLLGLAWGVTRLARRATATPAAGLQSVGDTRASVGSA
jgi:hypothetical protein